MIKAVSPGSSPSQSASGPQVNSLSTVTSAYLSDQVGRVLSATVTTVTEVTASKSGVTNNNNIDPIYRVELRAGNQPLVVSSPVAPRNGQTLQLEVLDASTLRILLGATAKNASAIETSGFIATKSSANAAGVLNATSATAVASDSPGKKTENLLPQIQQNLVNNLSREASAADSRAFYSQLQNLTSISANTAAGNTDSQLAATLFSVLKALRPSSTPNNTNPSNSSTPTATQPGISADAVLQTISKLPQLQQNALAQAIGSLRDNAQQFVNPLLVNNQPVSAEKMITALQNSGLFYENKLVSNLQGLFNRSVNRPANAPGAAQPTYSEAVRNQPAGQGVAGLSGTDRIDLNALKLLAGSPELGRDNKQQLLNLGQAALNLLKPLLPESVRVAANIDLASSGDPDTVWHLLENLRTTIAADGDQRLTTAQREVADPIMLLLKQVMSQLARTQTQQWLALGSQLVASENAVPQTLIFELPFLFQGQASPIRIYLEREKAAANQQRQEQDHWTLRLRFDMESYGELTALASLRQDNLTAVFWSETESLAKRIDSELSSFKVRMSDAGLNVSNIVSRVGVVDDAESRDTTQMISDSLLDTEA